MDYLNTSHVNLNLLEIEQKDIYSYHLNTSHVNLNPLLHGREDVNS